MYWKRCSKALLLATGLSVAGSGCTAVDALVSSRAGVGAAQPSGARVAAIGRMFENQGHYAQAESMYRNVLQSEPSNELVRQRLSYVINQRQLEKTQRATGATPASFALADSLVADTKPSPQATRDSHLRTPEISSPPQPSLHDALDNSAVVASLAPVQIDNLNSEIPAEETSGFASISEISPEDDITPEETPDLPSEVTVAEKEYRALEPVSVVPEESSSQEEPMLVLPDVPLVLSKDDTSTLLPADDEFLPFIEPRDSGDSHWQDGQEDSLTAVDAFESEVLPEIAPVGYDGSESHAGDGRTVDAAWIQATPAVSLETVLQWSEQPDEFVKELIQALGNGEDDGIAAIAASSLIEVQHQTVQIDDSLHNASLGGSEIVRVACLDALIQRGSRDASHIEGMLSSLRSDDVQIRVLAAACLSSLTETHWSGDCVTALGEMLDDSNDDVVAVAATTLSDFGEEGTAYHGRLVELLETTGSEQVSAAASFALTRIPAATPQTAPDFKLLPVTADDQPSEQDSYLPVVE